MTKLESFCYRRSVVDGASDEAIASETNRTVSAIAATVKRACRKHLAALQVQANEVNQVIHTRNLYVGWGTGRSRLVNCRVSCGLVVADRLDGPEDAAPVTIGPVHTFFTGDGRPVIFSWFPSHVKALAPAPMAAPKGFVPLPPVAPLTEPLINLPPARPKLEAPKRDENNASVELLNQARKTLEFTPEGAAIFDAVRNVSLTPLQWDALAIVVTEYKHA